MSDVSTFRQSRHVNIVRRVADMSATSRGIWRSTRATSYDDVGRVREDATRMLYEETCSRLNLGLGVIIIQNLSRN